MNTAPPIAISILFVVVPVFILAVATIMIITMISRSIEAGSRKNQKRHGSNMDLYPDPMMDPANPLSPLYQANQLSLPPDAQNPSPPESHHHHGGHHHGGLDGSTPPFDSGPSGGGFDSGGGHHH